MNGDYEAVRLQIYVKPFGCAKFIFAAVVKTKIEMLPNN